MNKLVVLVVVAAFVVVADASLDLPLRAQGGLAQELLERKLSKASGGDLLEPAYFAQRVDHFDPLNVATWQQKFFFDKTHWTPGGPIFVYLNGEGEMTRPASGYLTDVAQALGGAVASLEHRFYGRTMPAGDLKTSTLRHLLTVENALRDANAFIESLARNTTAETGKTSKFVVVGGSYAGALSSWFKQTMSGNGLTVASWSSSGVVNAILNFTAFDEQVAAALSAECVTAVKAVTTALEEAIMDSSDGGRAVKGLFGEGAATLSNADFAYMAADSAAMAVQYGHKRMLCDTLVPATNSSNLPSIFADFTAKLWGKDFGSNCFYSTECLKNTSIIPGDMSRAWRFQKCAQLAYIQVAPAKNSLRSAWVNYTTQIQQCVDVFGEGVFPQTEEFNTVYGGAEPIGTNIVYVDASDDPWQRASVDHSPSASQPYYMINCDGCGHCIDLHAPSESDPPSLTQVRQQILSSLEGFLKA